MRAVYTAVVPSFSPFFASRVTSSAKTSNAASIGPICAGSKGDSGQDLVGLRLGCSM